MLECDLYEIDLAGRAAKVGIIRKKIEPYEFDMNSVGYNARGFDAGILDETESLVAGGYYDILLGPEFLFSSAPPLDKHVKDKVTEGLIAASKGSKTLIVTGSILWKDGDTLRNTSPVICDGELVFEYDKRAEELVMVDAFGLKPYAGKRTGIFEWDGYRCGIELCADHGELYNESVTGLDFHFLVSGGRIPYPKYVAVRDGGYFMYSDSCGPETFVWKNENGKLVSIEPTGYIEVKNVDLGSIL